MELVDFRVLGRGGFSVVYVAEDPAFARQVAVKVLHNALDDPKAWASFETECRLAGRLSGHPGVVTLHTAGRTVSGAGYIVMEYLPGGSIAHLVRDRGALTASQVATVGRQIAEVLSVAHDTGTVHRDVKPENILLTLAGDAKLGDFGISALISNTTNGLTSRNSYTPDHVPPEVLRGHPADRASDVYSLCSTLYQLLTTSPPHRKAPDEPVATLLWRTVNEPIPPLPGHVPAELAALLTAGLNSDPSQRPSAHQLAVGLAALPADALWATGDAPSAPLGPIVASPLDGGHPPVFADPALTVPRRRAVDHPPDATPPNRRRALVALVVAALVVLAATATAIAATRTDHPRATSRDQTSTTTPPTTTDPPIAPLTVDDTNAEATTPTTTPTTPATSAPETTLATTLSPAEPAAEVLATTETSPPATPSTEPSKPRVTSSSRTTTPVAQAAPGPAPTTPAATTTTPDVTATTPPPTTAATSSATPAATDATPAPTTATTSTSTAPRATFAQGDATGDGLVNCRDSAVLNSVWGTDSPLADFNHDGVDNIFDASIIAAHWTGGPTSC